MTKSTAQAWNPRRKGVRGKPSRGDQFGWSVSATDTSGDGRDDLLIGIRLKDLVVPGSTVKNAGAAHLLYGTGSGITARGDRLLTQKTRGVRGAVERSDVLGSSTAQDHR